MVKIILKRLLWVIPVMLGVIFIVFAIDRFSPGDPVAAELGSGYTQEQYDAKEAELGLDRPFFIQFGSYVLGSSRETWAIPTTLGSPSPVPLPSGSPLPCGWPSSRFSLPWAWASPLG